MAKQKRYKGYLRKTFMYEGKRVYVYGKTAQELAENELKKRDELENGVFDLYNPTLDSYYEHSTSIRRSEIKESTLRSQRIQYKLISQIKLSSHIIHFCVLSYNS